MRLDSMVVLLENLEAVIELLFRCLGFLELGNELKVLAERVIII